MDAAADLVARHGGTLSGEHGDGRARGALLPRMFSPAMMAAFRDFKALWDPNGLLNPGIIVDPVPVTDSLRWTEPTRIDIRPDLAYHADHGDMRAAVSRCIGVGPLRQPPGVGAHVPQLPGDRPGAGLHARPGAAAPGDGRRARCRPRAGGRPRCATRSTCACPARAALSECPTGVDMASYKSEFLHHHYQGRLRPRSHYSLGALPRWLRHVLADGARWPTR